MMGFLQPNVLQELVYVMLGMPMGFISCSMAELELEENFILAWVGAVWISALF